MSDKQNNAVDLSANKKDHTTLNGKRKALWSLLFALIAGLSIWAVISQIEGFSFSKFWDFIASSNIMWIGVSVLSMLGFILFEGAALLYICRSFGYKSSLGQGFLYSASDIYFSAITPSATGGQPASAFFMIKYGIPSVFVTVALVANLVMYTASIVAMGLFAIIASPSTFLSFSPFAKFLIIFGIVAQLGLLLFFILLLAKNGLMRNICKGAVVFLGKLHILRNVDRKLGKMDRWMDDYSENTAKLKGKGKMMVFVFLFNLLQRLAQVAVTPFCALAAGASFGEAYDLFIIQIYALVGSNCVPIPGAMGVTDYLMIDGFTKTSISDPEFLQLFSRSLSFYMCIIICGISVLIGYCAINKRRKKV